MSQVWRHIRAIGLLPGMVTIVVPLIIMWRTKSLHIGWDLFSPANVGVMAIGALCIVVGLALMFKTIRLFATVGEGTLAPWDPPRRLVVHGVYRHVRNPMISGVFAILAGEVLIAGSVPLTVWLVIFVAINAIYIPAFEERRLAERYGAEYDEYKRTVPRWIPRLRPWKQ